MITEHPESQAVCDGDDATFTVVVTGDDLSYQWRKGGQDIDGATSDTLDLGVVTTADEGSYDVVVSNTGGSATSDAATLTVDTGPVITEHPAGQTVCQGVDVTFTVAATTEVGSLSYEWRKNDETISGATSATLVLYGVTPDDDGDYDVTVASPCGYATSFAATLGVEATPVIIDQPVGGAVCEDDSYTLSVTISSQASVVQDTVGSTSSSGSGARLRGNYYRVDTAITLTRIEQYLDVTTSGQLVFFVYEADAYGGPYLLIMEDVVADSGTGRAYYSSNPLAVLLQAGKYYLIGAAWPDQHTYYWNYGGHAAKSFGASLAGFAANWVYPLPSPAPGNYSDAAYMQRLTTSDLAMTYQWRKDDENIAGASGPEYTIVGMALDDEGDYDVVITNDCGGVTSDVATLTVDPGVTIAQGPQGASVCVGDPAVFTVTVDGTAWSYQWRKDGEEIVGATGSSYTISAAELNDAGEYDVIVGGTCSVTSEAATLTVTDAAPALTGQPADIVGCEGQQVAFAVIATGQYLHYQWQRDGVEIADAADQASYTIEVVDPNDVGDYSVVVSNGCGAVTSDVATLTVDEAISIDQHPQPWELCVGEQCVLDVVASGTNLAYQWRKDGVDVADATEAAYTISEADPNDVGYYDVVVSNGCGAVVSDAAKVTVFSLPVILEQPESSYVPEGTPVTLAVTVDLGSFSPDVDTIGEPVSYSQGNRARGNSYEVTQTATLTLIEHYLNITAPGPVVFFVYEAVDSEQGPYTLILEDPVSAPANGLGFYASHPIEVRLEAGRYYIIGAAWTGYYTYYWGGTNPQLTAFGQRVHGFASSYDGTLPYSPIPTSTNVWYQRLTTVSTADFCQWFKDGAAIPGATSDAYHIGAVTSSDEGRYNVEVSNACGTVLSVTATVRIVENANMPVAPVGGEEDDPDPPVDPIQADSRRVKVERPERRRRHRSWSS